MKDFTQSTKDEAIAIVNKEVMRKDEHIASLEAMVIQCKEIIFTLRKDKGYRNFGESITQNYPEWLPISEEDRKKYHLDVPIEELSLLPDGTSGCTPEGLLKKTIGMSRKDLPKQLY